ncbi:MAG: ArsR/SmtB family transcription factor [Candidatus Hodarchaeales archaeon]|jgi:predicted transcriptional regulator
MRRKNLDLWFQVLGNPYRRKILQLIAEKPLYQEEISKRLGITPRAVNNHLKFLEENGILIMKDKKRPKGGRNLKYCHLKNPFSFSIDIGNPVFFKINKYKPIEEDEYIDIEIEDNSNSEFNQEFTDISTDDHTSLEKIIREIQLSEDHIKEIQTSLSKELTNQKELSKKLTKFFLKRKLPSMIAYLYKNLLLKYGTSSSWSRKDILEILNTNYDTTNSIINYMEKNLGIIKFDKIFDDRIPKWKLIQYRSKENREYNY